MTEHILPHQYSPQETGYFCGPGSTQIALTARGIYVSERELANELGTDIDGTDWIGQITSVLASRTGLPYVTREIPNDPPTQFQRDLLWDDVVKSINGGNAMVGNIVAPPGNQPPGYPQWQTIYHYICLTGYDDETMSIHVSDPANFSGIGEYWLTHDKLASLISPKGYSACPIGGSLTFPGPDFTPRTNWDAVLEQFIGPKRN